MSRATALSKGTPNRFHSKFHNGVSSGLPKGRFLARDECEALAHEVASFANGGGRTVTHIETVWRGNIRWAKNELLSSGDTRNNAIGVNRTINGAMNVAYTNQIDSVHLEAAVRRAERLLKLVSEHPEAALMQPYMEPFDEPTLWFDRTYALQAEERAEAMRTLAQPAQKAGMLSAGYIQVSAHGRAIMDGGNQSLYYPFTKAQYSVTVRDPKTSGSGWAGVDWNDWGRIDAEAISAIALEKCLRSRNPVATEPGRYTTILEPQATADFIAPMIERAMDRYSAENWPPKTPFSSNEREYSKIGEQLIDERITISADPMDPDIGVPPFNAYGDVYHPVKWFANGVLQNLSYGRDPYAIRALGKNEGLPNSYSFKMSGGSTSVDDMVANTRRGILVTRFSDIHLIDFQSLLLTGVTRDGLWLIENGKISKAIRNFRFTDSPLFALNNVLDLGVPQRVFRPSAPTVTPAIRVQDFNFAALAEAI